MLRTTLYDLYRQQLRGGLAVGRGLVILINRGFDSDRGIIRATTLGKLFTPNVPLFTKQYNWYLARAFMLLLAAA